MTRYELQAPGGVPDVVLASKLGGLLSYVVTLEFKLANWRRALSQAFRNRNYGNEAYVVLDHSRLLPALQHLTYFQQANVGLVSIDTYQHVSVWHFPDPHVPFSRPWAREVARSILAPRRAIPDDILPFARSVRGGVALHPLRQAWGPPNDAEALIDHLARS